MRNRNVCNNWSTNRFHGNQKRTNDTNEIYQSAPAIFRVIFKDVGHLRMNREDWNRFHWTLPASSLFRNRFPNLKFRCTTKGIIVLSDQAREMISRIPFFLIDVVRDYLTDEDRTEQKMCWFRRKRFSSPATCSRFSFRYDEELSTMIWQCFRCSHCHVPSIPRLSTPRFQSRLWKKRWKSDEWWGTFRRKIGSW